MARSITPDNVNSPVKPRIAVFASSPDELATLKAELELRDVAVLAVLVPSPDLPASEVKHDGVDYLVVNNQDELRQFFASRRRALDAVFAPVNLAPLSGFTVARAAKQRRIHAIVQAQPTTVMPEWMGFPAQPAGTLGAAQLASAQQNGYTLLAYDTPNIWDAVVAAIPARSAKRA